MKLFKLEMKKAFHSSSFKIVLAIASVIAVICSLFVINSWINNEIYAQKAHDMAWAAGTDVNPEYAILSLYTEWIGMEITSYMSSLFFIMLAANEVPRIAQQFGLDSSVRVNMTSVIHTTATAVNLTKSIAGGR